MSAVWKPYYFVNATTPYQTLTGRGWYPSNSIDGASISNSTYYLNSSARYLFQGWSDGETNTTAHVLVDAPININALFAKQYLISIYALDNYSNRINAASGFVFGAMQTNSSVFLYANKSYTISSAYYKHVAIPASYTFTADSAKSIAC